MKPRTQKFFAVFLGTIAGVVLTIGGSSLIAKESSEGGKINRIPLQDVQRFSTAVSQIKNYYVKPVKDKDLFEDAIRGMLVGLDPHSAYLSEEDFKELQQTTRGKFSGLGIEVTMENGLIKVISPIDDTPAQKAGIQSGDYIIRLDDTPVKGMTLRDAVNKMRGLQGSSIQLMVLRKGETKPLKFTVTRDTIQIRSVKSRLLENKYGYVRISHFQSLTGQDLKKAVAKLKKEAKGKLAGLILDLRNNPGGLLDSAIQTSDAFIHNDQKGKEEMIVYTEGRVPGSKFTALATPGDIMQQAPIVVMINQGSASGSEIVAGALKDNKRAILMGTRSFGKGSVQTVLPLDGNRGIKLTTALYYTPSGTSIQAKGIAPDIVVEDMKIPQKKVTNNEDFAMIKEADLSGHLDNGNGEDTNAAGKKDKSAAKKDPHKKKLVHSDYQLYQALNLLKGMTLVRR